MAKQEYDVPALRRAIPLIELLCDSPHPLGVTEICQQLEINKNMVFRLIRTLVELGWVMPDSHDNLKYRMTLRPFHHTSKPVSRLNIRSATIEPLRNLWETTQTSCYVCVLEKKRALCIEHLDAGGPLRIAGSVGGYYYLHTTAPGKIFLAHQGDALLNHLEARDLPQMTPHTLTDKEQLREHLHAVRRQGYAIDNMENAEGVICYAVPVFNYEDEVAGAMGLSSLTFHYSVASMVAELGPLVDEAAKAASIALGASERALQSYPSADNSQLKVD